MKIIDMKHIVDKIRESKNVIFYGKFYNNSISIKVVSLD